MTRYVVGIDLGTSNTVAAYGAAGSEQIELLPIDQLVGPGEIASLPLLPSVRYHPAPGELNAADLELPSTGNSGEAVIGSFARDLGGRVPGRLVASAKSWLSHAGVDRSAPILPWGAPDEVQKISPVAASAGYLAHVRGAWNARFPKSPLELQDIVLTVPASFDEGARALTLEAARLAGLPTLRLLEEPQAAFHDWLFRHRHRLGAELARTRRVLVCDVGGGTTDLTLIQVDVSGGVPRLTRIGVGDHLMLGGDNMDLALAHLVEQRLGEGSLSPARFSQLVQRCRVAKETLLAADSPERVNVTLLGGGARLVGGARSVELGREEVERLLVDGFFPLDSADALPRRRRVGLVEFGLPYPADPAVTRHLAAFLQRHADASGTLPDTVLLNGGVFRARAIAARLVGTLGAWRGAEPRVLHNDNPDVAVARGAVAYGLTRSAKGPGAGRWIGGGAARSYFLVLEDGRAICVLPRGTEEGQEVELTERQFSLRLGQAVRFHLLSSAVGSWRAGAMAAPAEAGLDAFVRLPPLAAFLPSPRAGQRQEVTVRLTASMSEVGTLDMHCVSVEDAGRRWQLAFQLRGEAAPAEGHAPSSPRLQDALQAIERVFGSHAKDVGPKEVSGLRARLESLLGKREDWDVPLLRTLFDALWARARRRRRSAGHERVWLNLAGYCLRPGQGAALDAWRIGELWGLFEQGIQYVKENRNWSEWWTLWRRAAGGLPDAAQLRVMEVLSGHLEQLESRRRTRPSDPILATFDDMVSLAASLERVPLALRIEVGEWLLEQFKGPAGKAHIGWAVGRVGAREPMYGSAHNVVPADVAAVWLAALLELDWKSVEAAAFAAAQMARKTGDRARDLPPELQDEVVRRLEAVKAPHDWIRMVRETTTLDEADQRRSFGESLPPGLKLISPK